MELIENEQKGRDKGGEVGGEARRKKWKEINQRRKDEFRNGPCFTVDFVLTNINWLSKYTMNI